MDSDRWIDLPLFPLNTVLFPGMILPLHIFEERYKLMIKHCLDEECPFGVLLIREGKEVGGTGVPHSVGTSALIASVTREDDGRMNIVTIGLERFRLRNLRRDRPYLVGDAEPFPLVGEDTEQARAQVEPVRARLKHYLDLLEQAQGHSIEIDAVPTDPRTLALLVAITLQLPLAQKQGLLAQPDVVRMLMVEQSIMKREKLLLEYMIGTQAEQWEGGHSGYLAKN